MIKNSSNLLFLLAIVCWDGSSYVEAQPPGRTERYTVRKGDTLALLAAEYYGNREHKIYIMVENGLNHDRPIRPGLRLRIPVSQYITASVGDTLSSLAKSYLGDSSRAQYLADFNHIDLKATLALGQEITVPMRVRYKVQGKENLRNIALALFADARQTKLLRKYNSLTSNILPPGQILSIPLPKITVQPAKRRPPNADASARAKKRIETMQQAAISLPRAKNAWVRGDFALVKHELIKIEFRYLDASMASEAGILLGSAYIAFEDEDSALATFIKVLERTPEHILDPKMHSPKVRTVWEKALQEKKE